MKYVRLYGFDHTRTQAQFEISWKELRQGLPVAQDAGFLLGVSGNQLLLDGVAIEAGQAERSFAQLLNAAGLASISFSSQVTVEDFGKLVKAFASGGSKAQDVTAQIKISFADVKNSTIKINEVKFIAADPTTGEVSIAAQLAAQTLGPEFKDWLNDPQKLLQLIAASEGAHKGGGDGSGKGPGSGSGLPGNAGGQGAAVTLGEPAPLQEQEILKAIRLLTHFGQVGATPDSQPELVQAELAKVEPNVRLNLQVLLEKLVANDGQKGSDTPLLMKAAEHMAIQFALERFQRGDIKVNAVHQMLEQMSRQMETLRKILRMQEEKMGKAGILVESHADILDRMFWAEVPDEGKKTVLLSNDAHCVPPRNIRQFAEVLIERNDKDTVVKILTNYVGYLNSKEAEPRRKAAIGLSQLSDLFAVPGINMVGVVALRLAKAIGRETDPELQNMMGAAFVRISSEATHHRQYDAIKHVCGAMNHITKRRPVMAGELRTRIGVENRLPEFIEDAIPMTEFPADLIAVFRRTGSATVEHLAERFTRCVRREECDHMVELARELGPSAINQMRETLRVGPERPAAAVVGLLSRLNTGILLEFLPMRLKGWTRFYHDLVVRHIAYGAAPDRGRTLLELLEHLDPLVLPQTLDEIGMSGDLTTVPPLMAMASDGPAEGRSALLQAKAVEALGRLRATEAVPLLRGLLEAKKMWKWANHRELRIACAQALAKIDPRFASQIMSEAGLSSGELAIAPLDLAPASPWVRQRRYERVVLHKALPAIISNAWGKSKILIRELSLGSGVGTKEDNLRIGSEANLDISVGVRHIRGYVLLRRARMAEVGFELVDTDLDSRYRLRSVLVETLAEANSVSHPEWDGSRKP
ncbi:MAG TPA: HEAT repeat domain-containing protein [Terriglobales bacterium]